MPNGTGICHPLLNLMVEVDFRWLRHIPTKYHCTTKIYRHFLNKSHSRAKIPHTLGHTILGLSATKQLNQIKNSFNDFLRRKTCISLQQKRKPFWNVMKKEMTRCQWHLTGPHAPDNYVCTSSLTLPTGQVLGLTKH